MPYTLVNVLEPAFRLDTRSSASPGLSVDGTALVPGEYASTVMELPASQTFDGQPLVRGFYAVLWPMDETAPRYDQRPSYFGPFPSQSKARAFVDEVAVNRIAITPAADTASRPACCVRQREQAAGSHRRDRS